MTKSTNDSTKTRHLSDEERQNLLNGTWDDQVVWAVQEIFNRTGHPLSDEQVEKIRTESEKISKILNREEIFHGQEDDEDDIIYNDRDAEKRLLDDINGMLDENKSIF